MAGGRPLKWTKVEEIEPLIEKYFKDMEEEKRPFTISGLAYALDTSRDTLLTYQGKDEFFDTIKKAKDRCERYAEEKLYGGGQVAGVIFNMKNNYGHTDKLDLGGGVDLGLSKLSDEELDAKIEEKLSKLNQNW